MTDATVFKRTASSASAGKREGALAAGAGCEGLHRARYTAPSAGVSSRERAAM